jgi:hypothetical protein
VEEVGELELGEGLSEGKLREHGDNGDVVRMRVSSPPRGGPDCPYIESGARFHTKKEVLPIEGLVSYAILGCMSWRGCRHGLVVTSWHGMA